MGDLPGGGWSEWAVGVFRRRLRRRLLSVEARREAMAWFEAFIVEDDLRVLKLVRGGTMGRDPVDRKPRKQAAVWAGFKDVPLTDAQLDAFDHWDCHDQDLWDLLTEVLTSGHKISITFNSSNDTYNASFTGPGGTDDGKLWTLPAFSESWYDAVRLLVFKHSVICEGDWSRANGTNARRRG